MITFLIIIIPCKGWTCYYLDNCKYQPLKFECSVYGYRSYHLYEVSRDTSLFVYYK